MAAHLFLLYYGILSYITPPVAMGAYPASSIAETDSLGIALAGTRFGGAIYFIPFWFIFEPILLFQDPSSTIPKYILIMFLAVIGVFLMASALCGYMRGVGNFVVDGNKSVISVLLQNTTIHFRYSPTNFRNSICRCGPGNHRYFCSYLWNEKIDLKS